MTEQEQARAVLAVTVAIGDAIRDLRIVPSGVLYANLASEISLENYKTVVHALKETGLVREDSNVLYWVGPLRKVEASGWYECGDPKVARYYLDGRLKETRRKSEVLGVLVDRLK